MHSVEIKPGSSHQFPVMCILLGIDCVKCVQTCWWFFVKGWGVKKVVPERHLMVRFQILQWVTDLIQAQGELCCAFCCYFKYCTVIRNIHACFIQHPSIYLSNKLSLSICLFVCLSVYLSIYLSISNSAATYFYYKIDRHQSSNVKSSANYRIQVPFKKSMSTLPCFQQGSPLQNQVPTIHSPFTGLKYNGEKTSSEFGLGQFLGLVVDPDCQSRVGSDFIVIYGL